MDTKTILIFVIVIIAVVIGAMFLSPREIRESGPDGDSAGLIIGENGIYVAEQVPSKNVSVTVVRFDKSGFVVIHEHAKGAPGKILGASSLLIAGETKDSFQIPLSRSTMDGEIVYAMLHLDDGDRLFDATKDKPVLDRIGGEPVMTIVTISKDATEPSAVNPL